MGMKGHDLAWLDAMEDVNDFYEWTGRAGLDWSGLDIPPSSIRFFEHDHVSVRFIRKIQRIFIATHLVSFFHYLLVSEALPADVLFFWSLLLKSRL